jgi:hypothetical protein
LLINDEAQKQVLAIVAKSAGGTSSKETQQRAGAILQLDPGQQVKVEIIANLPNSLYLARIAGEMYQLDIPLNVHPGETMDLTFVSADPRLTFSVVPPEGGVLSVKLSSLGRWLAGVMEQTPPPPVFHEPLLEGPEQGTALLAAKLRTAISRSGLFYEAHLARWAAGSLPLAEILGEPQGKLSRTPTGTDEGGEGEAQSADASFADGRTLPFVKEQLQILNNGRFTWRGEAWPGQRVELTVTDLEEATGKPVEATLALELPQLGTVEAKLSLAPDGVSLELVCAHQGGAALLREAGEGLRLALFSSGLHLRRLSARDGEEETG